MKLAPTGELNFLDSTMPEYIKLLGSYKKNKKTLGSCMVDWIVISLYCLTELIL